MTEQPTVPGQPAGDEESTPAGPDDGGQPDNVRTQGETAVDEAMGPGTTFTDDLASHLVRPMLMGQCSAALGEPSV